jgi:hypothetical protein
MVTLLKRVASMTEAQFELHQTSHDTISGKILKFIRSHTKSELNNSEGPPSSHSILSFRSNRVAVDPEENSKPSSLGLKSAVAASLEAPVDEEEEQHESSSPVTGRPKSVPDPSTGARHEPLHQDQDPNETKDCEDHSPLRSFGDHQPLSNHHPNELPTATPKDSSKPIPVKLPPITLSLTNNPASTSASASKASKKRRIIKKLSKSGSFSASAEGGEGGGKSDGATGGGDGGGKNVYRNPLDYIRQNSAPSPVAVLSPAASFKEFRSSPSLPMKPESQHSFRRKHKENNFIEEEEELNLEITSMKLQQSFQDAQGADEDGEEEEEKSSCCSTPLTPTRYDRKTSMKLDSAPIRTPRDKPLVKPLTRQKTSNSEGGSSAIHSSESLIPEVDPFSWQQIKEQLLTSMRNGFDEVLDLVGLRHYGSTISLTDCFQSTFSPQV